MTEPAGEITAEMVNKAMVYAKGIPKLPDKDRDYEIFCSAIAKALNQQLASSEARGEPLCGFQWRDVEHCDCVCILPKSHKCSHQEERRSQRAVSSSAGRAEPQPIACAQVGCGLRSSHEIHDLPYGDMGTHPFVDPRQSGAASVPEPAKPISATEPANPFSKGYKHRHGEPVSDACGDNKHAECTQDLTKCHCTVRSGHIVMHAYMSVPVGGAAAPAPTLPDAPAWQCPHCGEWKGAHRKDCQRLKQIMVEQKEPAVQPGTETAREWLDRNVPLQFLGSDTEPVGVTHIDKAGMADLLTEFAEQRLSAMRAVLQEVLVQVEWYESHSPARDSVIAPSTRVKAKEILRSLSPEIYVIYRAFQGNY